MANNSPTLVMASLSDDQLKKSIDSLVTHVDEAMKKMVQSTNNAVGEMEAKLKSLGSLKIDTGGSNDGGTGRRTQQHEKLTKAVNDASEAVSKETQKLQDLQQSLSGASDREQNFVSQKERAASTIAQENELLGKQQSELAALKTQQQSLVDAEQRGAQAKQQNAAAIEKQRGQVKFYEEELNSLQARLTSAQAKIDRFYEVQAKARESISSRLHAPSDQFIGYNDYERGKSVYSKTEQDVRSLIKALSELDNADKKHGFGDELRRAYINLMPSQDMANVFKRQQEEISSYIKTLQEAKKGTKGETRANLDNQILAGKELLAIYKELGNAQNALNKTVQKEGLRDGGNVGGIKRDIEETQKAYGIAKQKLDELTQSSQQSAQASQQKAQIDAQVAAKEKEIAETKGRIATATREQTEAERNASQAAREKANIQGQVANQEKKVAEAKKQLTTATQQHTDAETKSSRATKEKTMTLDQQASAINTAVQSQKKYTDEVLRQAAAIRSSKEWQEKGHVVVGDVNYYDKERANVSKRDKQLLLSLEEQIVQAQQKEAQEALVAAEANRQKAQAAKEAAQAMRGVSSYDLGIDPNVSAGRQRQIESTRKASKETEYLKQQVASLLEVEEREVKSVNMTTASYSELSQYLKQLQSAYNKLGADRIKKGEGVDIADEIQRTQRAMQKLQQTMSRPVSLKDALGGSEKTLDDIAYKMRQLASYRSGLNFKTQADEIDKVNKKYAALQKKMNEVMAKNSQMASSNNILANSWRYMRNRLAFYLTVSTGVTLIRDLARVRSEYEMNEKALGTLLNSAERGTRIFNELSNMALVSPYTLIELSAAAKQLTAYDIAAKDVVDTTRRLADISAAVGIPVERLTYALGQVKAYGHLTSQDARQFLNAGVPLVKELANRYSELEGKLVSTADVYDRMKKHAISYNDVLSVLTSMTDEGGRFFDYQAKMAETLKVRLANLSLAYNNMLNDMGKANGGAFTTGIKGLTALLKHWREIERVLGTVVVGIGAYKAATFLAGITTQKVSGHSVAAWLRWASAIRTTQGNVALLSATMKAIPFAGWFTAIASLVSYFVFFNNSSDETKQKLQDIATAFEGIRKETTDLFADAISTDSLGTQLTKLKDMLELAETELGITIPINLEDVNESNVKQKLREAKNTIDNYVNFSQTFSESAVDTRFNESMTDFGTTARSAYTSVTESINTVKVALQELVDAGKASRRDIEILKELDNKPKEGESRIEYFQRLVKLYEELGLLGQKETVVPLASTELIDNMDALQLKQEASLDRLGIKNKTVFETMLSDVQGYYNKSSIAANQFEQQIERVAKSINLDNIPIEERTAKLEVAINQEAAKNNWNEFAIQYAKLVANEKFGLNITISEESKKDAEMELSDWQKRMQSWADKHGITFSLNFMEKEDEKTYADRMLQAAKDAQGKLDVLRRKLKVGTGSQTDVDNATKDYNNARLLALQAGADLSSLDKKSASSRKAASKAESELAKALKDELSTIDKVRSIYKDLTKEGMSHADAVERATRGWDETVNAINRVLQKNGLQKLDLSKFAGIENPRELVNMLQSQLNTLLKRGAKAAEIKELQTKIQTLNVDAEKYDLTKITKGLNNELGKLKDEYELAVELDADPELGNAFASMMGIDIESLPHTVKEYADRYSTYLNKYLKGKNSSLQFTGDELRGLTRDDITAFREQVNAGSFNQEWFDAILKAYEDISGKRKKDLEETEKWKNSLIEKYGNLQDKLTKIYKDSVQNQVNAVKTFGTEDQKSEIVRLQLRLEATDDPAELADINLQIAEIVKDVTDKNPIALKVVTSSKNQEEIDTSKAYWEDFKNSELYTMTFEDMANNSTRAIQLIMDKLDALKDKVKEDPASMKALMKSLEDAEKELNTRDPFGGIVSSLRDMSAASQETKAAQEALWRAEVDVEQAQQEVDNAEDGTPEEQAAAQQKLAQAIQRRANAQVKLTQAENKGKKAQENLKNSLQGITNQLGNVQGLFGVVSKLFRAGGDDETADAIDAINEGFTVMTQVIMGVMAAMVILESSNPWLLAIAAALSVIVGLVSFLIGNDDKKIVEQIEESERAVKRLENTYKNLSHTAEEAYGAMVSGAKKAMQSNKELQLVELKRQLALEKSRDSKHRDEDKIADLEGQIIDLKNEIHDATQDIINDLLDISSAGDGIESLVSVMIDAFRNGEDAMEAFGKEWDKMIDNMILKLIVTQFMKQAWDTVMDNLKKKQEEFLNNPSQAVADAQKEVDRLSAMSDAEIALEIAQKNGTFDAWGWIREGAKGVGVTNNMIENYKKAAQDALTTATEVLNGQSLDYTKWSLDYMNHEGRDYMMQYAEMLKNSLGDWYTYGENNTKELSALQAGIKGITEDTAGALEAYMNGVSQQVYLHSDLLTQIRDAVVGFDIDVQTASLSQILLQLQTNYVVMQSMQSMMEGWTTPSGQGIRVELIS